MRRRLVVMLAALLAFAVLTALPVAADEDQGGTYLALGDSVAAGTQQPAPFTDNGYGDRLYRHLQDEYGFDTYVNLACPGDDTSEMINGDFGLDLTVDPPEIGSACYGAIAPLPPGGSSQLDAAVDYLRNHPGEVKLITITIGANDILRCAEFGYSEGCIADQLAAIGGNLPVILGTLQRLAPGVPIVGTNYYNPNLALALSDDPVDQRIAAGSQQLTMLGNGVLEAVYGNPALGVPVADVASAFDTYATNGKVPKNLRSVCRLTLMCEKSGSEYVLSDYAPGNAVAPQPDIHPSNKGHQRISQTIAQLIDRFELLDG